MNGLPHLQWHAKPFGAGDIDGTGTQRLLGQPDLDLVDLLVRETAQNSWDARLSTGVPEFELRLRTLSVDQMHLLRTHVFTQTGPTGGLRKLLASERIGALEILDRGTKGLGGTLRIDLQSEGPRDWVDFVLAVGAPPDTASGGGTYGFGKTASYAASSCSTILIWSVTEHAGRIEHRLIASAINEGFNQDGRRFTGRQWWGSATGMAHHQIEPVTGDAAQMLGEHLFERPFSPGETGTSILVLAPRTLFDAGDDDIDAQDPAWADALPSAIIRSLWPKLLPGQAQQYRMDVRAFDHENELPLVQSSASPTLAAMHRCLESVRSGEDGSDLYLKRFEVRSQRPKQLIGHLSMTRFRRGEDDPAADLVGTVSLMREPELVVRAQLHPGNRKDPMSWVGVFKPVEVHDRAFAASEPPAHDAWAPQSVNDKNQRRTVNIALKRIRELTQEFLTPSVPSDQASKAQPTAALSARLGALAGTSLGARPVGGGSSRIGGGRSDSNSNGRVVITSISPLERNSDDLAQRRERSRVNFEIHGAQGEVELSAARLQILIEGGSLPAGQNEIRIDRWLMRKGDSIRSALAARFAPGAFGAADISHPMGVAVDVELKLSAVGNSPEDGRP